MKNSNFDRSNNIFSYWYNSLKSTGIWNVISKCAKHIRRYFFISRLIKIITAIIAVIETSATLIIVATGFLVALPFILLALGFTALLGIFSYRKYDPKIERDIKIAKKIIFIEAKKGFYRKRSAYLNRMARCFRDEGALVFVVSKGLHTDRFLSARKADRDLWVIRLGYYYHLKKRFLKDKDNIITYIY